MEILKLPFAKEMEITVEIPEPKKGDKSIAELLLLPLNVASKIRRIKEIVESHNSVLIFTNTREAAEMLANKLRILDRENKLNIAVHHSSLSRDERIRIENEFKEGKRKAMVCTSSLELGIDIGSIDIVVQYSSPKQVKRLLQRMGRSGHRIGKKSRVIIIAGEGDDALESIAIAKSALEEKIESIRMHENSLDVVAHQIAGIILENRHISKNEIFGIIKKSYSFRNLSYEDFDKVYNFMLSMGLLRFKNLREYYYANISTIPEDRKYIARDITTRKLIGYLDEAFVASLDFGNLIILKAFPWRIVNIEDSEVLLEPVSEISGELPSWIGEEIPVEYEIAQIVGRMRRSKKILEDKKLKCNNYTKKLAFIDVRKQEKLNLPIASDNLIYAEIARDTCVINACFGKRINETLGRAFSAYLSIKKMHTTELKADGYRIILRALNLTKKDVEELFSLSYGEIESLLKNNLKKTMLFKYKFIHVAKRFGVISKEASLTSVSIDRLINALEDTVVFRETLREIFTDNLDLEKTKKVIERIKKGEISVVVERSERLSPISLSAFTIAPEFVLPERAERAILKALKKRILSKRIMLFCTYCASWHESYLVRTVYESRDLKCGNCSAKTLALLAYDEQKAIRTFRKYRSGKKLTADERRIISRYMLAASLFLSYGENAILALSARGIGVESAKRILKDSRTEEELLRNILKQEKNYARTRRFWD